MVTKIGENFQTLKNVKNERFEFLRSEAKVIHSIVCFHDKNGIEFSFTPIWFLEDFLASKWIFGIYGNSKQFLDSFSKNFITFLYIISSTSIQ